MKLLIDIPEHIYEHAKEMTEDSRDEGEAMRAIANGSRQESRLEIPNTCGDAISRQAVLDAMYELCDTGETLNENPWRDNPHIDAITDAINYLPSVTPQPRMGRWIAQDTHNCHTDFRCSECGYVHSFMHLYGEPTADYTYCPQCGTKMEVEE